MRPNESSLVCQVRSARACREEEESDGLILHGDVVCKRRVRKFGISSSGRVIGSEANPPRKDVVRVIFTETAVVTMAVAVISRDGAGGESQEE